MKIEIKPTLKIREGTHRGVIKAVEYRTQPFNYTDLVIEFEEGTRIKVGYPTQVTPDSKLGKLLTAFGAQLVVGEEIEPEVILKDRNVTFLTINKTSDRGTFANVMTDSVKPA